MLIPTTLVALLRSVDALGNCHHTRTVRLVSVRHGPCVSCPFTRRGFAFRPLRLRPIEFKSRREAKDWCVQRYPGSPIKEIGADATKRLTRAMPRKKPLRRRDPRTAETKNPPESDGSQKAWAKLGEVP